MSLANLSPLSACGVTILIDDRTNGLAQDFEHHLGYWLGLQGQDSIKLTGQLEKAANGWRRYAMLPGSVQHEMEARLAWASPWRRGLAGGRGRRRPVL